MKKSKRISIILNLLKKEEYTINQIHSILIEKKGNISVRQLQRDIYEIEELLEGKEELLKIKKNKEKYYSIKSNLKREFDKINSHDTLFYHPIEKQYQEKLIQLNNAINKRVEILIKIKNDLTSDNSNFEDESFVFFPVSIINHRNLKYIGGWNPKLKCIQIFGINQVLGIQPQNKNYNMSKINKNFYEELNKRFGVTKNIDNNVYSIKIEVSKVLVDFIKSHNWHTSQKIITEKNKTFLHLECGINRELIGWIFQWIYNVKVIEPEILKVYYNKALNEIKKINSSNIPLVYRNIFVEKEN